MNYSVGEGRVASYIGASHEGVELGDRGIVLSLAGSGSYVQWRTGGRLGQVTLEDNQDLAPAPRHIEAAHRDSLDDSLEVGVPFTRTAVVEAYSTEGGEGVLAFLASTGHGANFLAIADEALALVASRMRADPVIREAAAMMDAAEATELVLTASQALLRGAFSVAGLPEDDDSL